MFWKKRRSITDDDDRITRKMIEYISLKCNCGNLVIDEESDVFMVGFESDQHLDDYQAEFSTNCSYCNNKIYYNDLDNKSKDRFNEVVRYFIEFID